MLIGVFNHYNNNGYALNDITPPDNVYYPFNIRISKKGIAVIVLNKKLDIKEKLGITAKINQSLKEVFNQQISFAYCAFSDCCQEHELSEFYNRIKEINLEAISMCVGERDFIDSELEAPIDKSEVDFIIDREGNIGQQIIDHLVGDKEITNIPTSAVEWCELVNSLKAIVKKAEQDIPVVDDLSI